jgi:hypothetical protein
MERLEKLYARVGRDSIPRPKLKSWGDTIREQKEQKEKMKQREQRERMVHQAELKLDAKVMENRLPVSNPIPHGK